MHSENDCDMKCVRCEHKISTGCYFACGVETYRCAIGVIKGESEISFTTAMRANNNTEV